MVEHRPILTLLAHLVLVLGVLTVAFPVWLAFVASTHETKIGRASCRERV